MRTTVVPAQVTTVEDKIAGNLGVLQLFLLVMPVFGGSASFIVFPPFFSYAPYKLVIILCLCAFFGVLAIRFKERLLLNWLIILFRYNLRPRYYVFNKNNSYLRERPKIPEPEKVEKVVPKRPKVHHSPLTTAEIIRIEDLIANPEANLQILATKKGELRVHLTEVK